LVGEKSGKHATLGKKGASSIATQTSHSRITKTIDDIFAADPDSVKKDTVPPRRILIEGAPGIGKTVLAKEIAFLWAQRRLLENVAVLFLLILRDPHLQAVESETELIQYILKSISSVNLNDEQVEIFIEQLKSLQVCVILDGYDEYPVKLHGKSFIAKLIKGKIFPNTIVVITSRPTATMHLHDMVERRIEILGFAQKERDEYIKNSLKNSVDKREQLKVYLKCHPIINGLMYVPLHLAVLLYLFKVQSILPETLTEMNESFILHTIYRSLKKHGVIRFGSVNTAVHNLEKLPNEIYNIIYKLSELAYGGMQNNKLVFSYDDITNYCPEIDDIPGSINGFGLLQVVQHFSQKGPGETASFNFLHYTMQEFLAAFYLTKLYPKQQVALLKATFWEGRYNFMWMMYVGLNGVSSEAFTQFLYRTHSKEGKSLRKHIETDKSKCLHLFQCFMEAKGTEVPRQISSLFQNGEISFRGIGRLHPQHISSLLSYISKYDIQLQTLDLRDCHIGDIGMNILEQFFTLHPLKALNLKKIDLFDNDSVLLSSVYHSIYQQHDHKRVDWSSLGRVDIEEIVTFLSNNTIIESLNISGNRLKDNGAKKISNILFQDSKLVELDISNNNISIVGAVDISEAVKHNATLQYLIISWDVYCMNTGDKALYFASTHLKDDGARTISNVLCFNRIVISLDLSNNELTDNCTVYISECLQNNCSLKEVNLSRNVISSKGLKRMASTLKVNQSLRNFNISHNFITDDGAKAIGECLKSNKVLQKLDLSANEISSKGIFDILSYIQSDSSLDCLNVSYNNVSLSGLIMITSVFKALPKIFILCVSFNKLSFDNRNYVITASDLHVNNADCNLSTIGITDQRNLSLSNRRGNFIAEVVGCCLKEIDIVRVLNLSHHEISCKGLLNIADVINTNNLMLMELDISYNNVFDDGMIGISEYLRKSNTIEILNLSRNNLTYIGAKLIGEAIERNETLRQLDISYNEISDDGVVAISKSVKKNNSLKQLKISCNNLYLILDRTVHSFSVCNTNFGDTGATLLSAFLSCSSTILNLVISQANLSDKGAVAISEFLKVNSKIENLDVSRNRLTCDGIRILCKGIKVNITLRTLDISHNNISDDGVITISETVKQSKILQKLSLSWNNIHFVLNSALKSWKLCKTGFGDVTVTLISSLLYHNTLTAHLDLSHNHISDGGAIAISECLKHNDTLKTLNISKNKITSNGIGKLCNSIKVIKLCKHLIFPITVTIYLKIM